MRAVLIETLLASSSDVSLVSRPMAGAEPSQSELELVCRAAERLKPLERDILALSAGRGMLIGDIALLLGLSERRVERILTKALYKFDRALERQCSSWWRFW